MQITIHDKAILIERLEKWIEKMQYILDKRRDLYWSCCEMVDRHVVTHPLSWSKNLFKEQFIDRYQRTLDAIKGDNLHCVDWIDYRDVLYWVCFSIDMLDYASYKHLRESYQDLTIRLTGDTERFEGFIQTHMQFI